MKTLLVITFMTLLPCGAFAQEVYKWEDEKGVIHYGDAPRHPQATPLEKDTLPYSNTDNQPSESPAAGKARFRRGRNEARAGGEGRQPSASPSLTKPKAWLDRNSRLRLSGTLRNGGKGICQSPAVEVVVFDGNGSVDGSFTTAALPDGLARGGEAHFAGEYFTPVGESLSWSATPRCGASEGIVYGTPKRGTLRLHKSRTLRLRKFKSN